MKKADIFQALKFASVGVVNTALDYGLFYLFFSLLNLDKNLAQILATALAMANSYLVNRYWTFRKNGGVRLGEIWRFAVINLLSLGTTLFCLNLFHDWLEIYKPANAFMSHMGISFALVGDTAVLFCKLLAFPFSWTVNFLGNRLWVFSKEK